VIRTPRLR